MRGNRGDDRLSGGIGGDTLRGGSGADNLRGTAGPDDLFGGRRDEIDCGPGFDTVFADRFDDVADDCETVRRSGRR